MKTTGSALVGIDNIIKL